MSLLNSKFDIVSVDNPVAVSALAQVLDVDATLLPSPVFTTNGTPSLGTIAPGMIVTMNSSGKAVLGSTGDISANPHTTKKMPFVVVDGNSDYSGGFTQKLTCLQGGFTMQTDQWTSGAPATDFAPGKFVSFNAGKIIAATATNQFIGMVGPAGYDSVEGTVQVIVPQGGI